MNPLPDANCPVADKIQDSAADMLPVYVVAAAALSRFGCGWQGLRAAQAQAPVMLPSCQLLASHGEIAAAEVPPLAPEIDIEARARKLMSYPAQLAAVALRQLLHSTGWIATRRQDCGFYLGVGASGANMPEINAMLAASMQNQQFDLARFGQHGLAACNPLFAFQLMNNFTMCHGAILGGVGGPNSALFSRGNGTVAALVEAHWLLASGQADDAIAGGADSALHPATWAQLQRDGYAEQGLVPGEGAALLALTNQAGASALARLVHCEFHSASAWRARPELLRQKLASLQADGKIGGKVDSNADAPAADAGGAAAIVLAPWGQPARAALLQALQMQSATLAQLPVLDISPALGDSLAASPALGWCVALDWLTEVSRVLVLNAGIDGGFGITILSRPT